MEFKNLHEVLKLKIRKTLNNKDFDLSLLEDSFVKLNSEFSVDSIYCKGYELLFKDNSINEINKLN